MNKLLWIISIIMVLLTFNTLYPESDIEYGKTRKVEKESEEEGRKVYVVEEDDDDEDDDGSFLGRLVTGIICGILEDDDDDNDYYGSRERRSTWEDVEYEEYNPLIRQESLAPTAYKRNMFCLSFLGGFTSTGTSAQGYLVGPEVSWHYKKGLPALLFSTGFLFNGNKMLVDYERDAYQEGIKIGIQRDLTDKYYTYSIPVTFNLAFPVGYSQRLFIKLGGGINNFFEYLTIKRRNTWEPVPKTIQLKEFRVSPLLVTGLGLAKNFNRSVNRIYLDFHFQLLPNTKKTSIPSDNEILKFSLVLGVSLGF